MFILAEKITPPPRIRGQIFNDHAAEDVAQKKRDDDDRWVKRLIAALAGLVRKIQMQAATSGR
jgi:hypothetical protein